MECRVPVLPHLVVLVPVVVTPVVGPQECLVPGLPLMVGPPTVRVPVAGFLGDVGSVSLLGVLDPRCAAVHWYGQGGRWWVRRGPVGVVVPLLRRPLVRSQGCVGGG